MYFCEICGNNNREVIKLGEVLNVYYLLKYGKSWHCNLETFSDDRVCCECHEILVKCQHLQEQIQLKPVLQEPVSNINNVNVSPSHKCRCNCSSLRKLNCTIKTTIDFTFTHDYQNENESLNLKLENVDIFETNHTEDKLEQNNFTSPLDDCTYNTDLSDCTSESENDNLLSIQNEIKKKCCKKSPTKQHIPTPENMRQRCELLLSTNKVFKHFYKEELEQSRITIASSEPFTQAVNKCNSCLVAFQNEKLLEQHVEKYHKHLKRSYPFHKCPVCESYIRSNRFGHHYSGHYVQYKCNKCGHKYSDTTTLRDHMAGHGLCRRNKSFCCNICDKYFNYSRALVYHKQREHGEMGNYKCELCGKTFDYNLLFQEHLRRHKNPKAVCNLCGKGVKNVTYLKQHMNTVHGSTSSTARHSCECGAAYASAALLRAHRMYSKKHNHLRHMCDVCGKKLVTSASLRKHVTTVHEKKSDHVCHQCDKVFVSNSALQLHVRRVHEGVKLIKNKECKTCGKKFHSAGTLRDHVNTHTGERPHTCTSCGDTFRHKAALFTHNRLVHLGYKKKTSAKKKKDETTTT